MRYFILALLYTLFFAGCKKENISINCQLLQKAIETNDNNKASEAITLFIESLPSKTHTPENLQLLVSSISGQCSLSSQVVCYACIQTLPEQSEIKISFLSGTTVLEKIIDISQSADQKMRFVNMHQ